MRIVITEPTELENTKSIGCWFIEESIRKNGFEIEYVEYSKIKNTVADVYLFSVHHVKDIFYLADLYKYKKGIWIGGGHVMNNPYPFLHFFDLICIGEGETWIIKILNILNKKGTIKDCLEVEGTLSLENKDKIINKQYEEIISNNTEYYNASHCKGHSDIWYIELARGCKSKCFYCELGWTNKYRENNKDNIVNSLEKIKCSQCKKVNIFAPDDFSVSFYDEIMNMILDNNLSTNFGSMRIDNMIKLDKKQKKNFLFRMGLDGFSERIRKIINKKTDNENIIKLFSTMNKAGFVMYKFFLIFSYPFEVTRDYNEFIYLIKQLKNETRQNTRPVFLRIKFTPLIPNFYTPFEDFIPNYNKDIREQIEIFFLREKQNKSNIVIINDGIMENYTYYTQSFLSRADYDDVSIELLLNRKKLNFYSEELAKKTKNNHNIKMYIPDKSLVKAKNKLNERIKKYAI